MINRRVDSHGNHPRVGAERGEEEPQKRVKATLAEYTKMIAHKGIFVLSKRGDCVWVQWPTSCANVLVHISNL